METKKVTLFIVEGVTDKTSLGGIIDKLVSSNLVRFYIIRGDITSERFSNSTNAVKKVNEYVKKFLDKEMGIKKSDIARIVHLVDMDGAYIDSDQIQVEDVEEFVYSESAIISKSTERVIKRNRRKQQVINRLSLCPKISGIPYRMFYFSCKLEYVLHNEINMADKLKMEYAERFSDSYYTNEATFVDFIRDEQFAVKGDYRETWGFIKRNGNSLKRYSNFHLFFE